MGLTMMQKRVLSVLSVARPRTAASVAFHARTDPWGQDHQTTRAHEAAQGYLSRLRAKGLASGKREGGVLRWRLTVEGHKALKSVPATPDTDTPLHGRRTEDR